MRKDVGAAGGTPVPGFACWRRWEAGCEGYYTFASRYGAGRHTLGREKGMAIAQTMQYLMQSADKSVVECRTIATTITTAVHPQRPTANSLCCNFAHGLQRPRYSKQTETTVFVENVLK